MKENCRQLLHAPAGPLWVIRDICPLLACPLDPKSDHGADVPKSTLSAKDRHRRKVSWAGTFENATDVNANRFVRWRRAGIWGRIMDALAIAHDASVQMIDSSIVRVHQHAACVIRNRKQSMARSRGGLTCKIHAVIDTNGLPVRLALTAGEAHDNRLADKMLSRLTSGSMLLADRGYDADWIRALAARKGALANIPPRCNRTEPICFSSYLYRVRNLVERFFNMIKHCRRVATRYDKLAANYLAFVQLASIRLWLRVNESMS